MRHSNNAIIAFLFVIILDVVESAPIVEQQKLLRKRLQQQQQRHLSPNDHMTIGEIEFEKEVEETKKKEAEEKTNNYNNKKKVQQRDIPPLKELPTSPTNTFHVFQISHTHVASTLTVNILTGLFDGRDAYRSYLLPGFSNDWHHKHDPPFNSTLTTKSHVVEIPTLDMHFGPNGITEQFDNLFFVGNIRAEENTFLPPGYCDINNDEYNWRVVCLEYDSLLYETIDELREVVHYVASAVNQIPYFSNIKFNEEQAVLRIMDFDEILEECHDADNKFGIGGGKSCDHTGPTIEEVNNNNNNNP